MSSPQVVVMGVSGCGKSTVGRALAAALQVPYVDGDDLHPPANVQRMAAGIALTDEDRAGWLQQVGHALADAGAQARGVVVSCSALKRRYRDTLRQAAPALRLVYLQGSEATIAQRLAGRSGHYMPATLLPSQLAALEPPQADEQAIVLDISQAPEALVARACNALQG